MNETKPKIVESIQFNPHERWPDEVRPWDRIVPRDMSWGFIDTTFGRIHVQAGDWICKISTGQTILVKDVIYKSLK